MNIWQMAPPAAVTKSVAEFYLRYGVALLWPGDRGPWSPERYRDDFALSDWVRWFAEDMKDGDAVLLRTSPSFLRALGWPPERIALKWRNVDVALFRALPRTPENCQVLTEAKRLGAGVEQALDQAVGYLKALSIRTDVLVTDSIRYRLYSSPALEGHPSEIDATQFEPVAYANLVRLKQPATELFLRLQRV